MSSVYGIALSGLVAQSTAIAARASNIANMRTSGRVDPAAGDRHAYEPVTPVQTSQSGGGVVTDIVSVKNGVVALYEPDSPDANADGRVAYPNIRLEEEITGLLTAKTAYTANAKVIGVQRDMDRALLDILT
jgi:flagellar basal-body rod protein FlgC